jgi:hypothetical protein
MAKTAAAPTAAPTFSTTGTVSSPLDLDTLAAKGEHEAVHTGSSKSKIWPKPKVTLTSLTPNNVSANSSDDQVPLPGHVLPEANQAQIPAHLRAPEEEELEKDFILTLAVWDAEKDKLGDYTNCLL